MSVEAGALIDVDPVVVDPEETDVDVAADLPGEGSEAAERLSVNSRSAEELHVLLRVSFSARRSATAAWSSSSPGGDLGRDRRRRRGGERRPGAARRCQERRPRGRQLQVLQAPLTRAGAQRAGHGWEAGSHEVTRRHEGVSCCTPSPGRPLPGGSQGIRSEAKGSVTIIEWLLLGKIICARRGPDEATGRERVWGSGCP